MSDDARLERVQAIVVRVAGPARTPPHVNPDTSLAHDGFWLDSIAMLEVLVACEEEFGVVFDWQAELTPEVLTTIRSLADVIQKKTS